MTSYREILRLDYLGLSRTSIGSTLGYSRNTVAKVLRRAQLKGVVFPLPSDMNDLELRDMLFPEKAKEKLSLRKIIDFPTKMEYNRFTPSWWGVWK